MATETEEREPMESIARVRHIRVTPQKARRVVDLIRGKQATEALADPEVRAAGARPSRSTRWSSRAIANARVKADRDR